MNCIDFKQKETRNSFIWQSLLIAIFLFGLILSVTFIIPDFIFGNLMKDGHLNNFWNYLTIEVFNSNSNWNKSAVVLFFTFWIIGQLCVFIYLFWFSRAFIVNFTYKRWIKRYMFLAEQIINNANLNKVNPKVAMIVYVCNDLTPSTILQTAKQTYKNIDVWLLDDSSKPEAILSVQKFAEANNFHLCRRSNEHKKAHPTMIGNMFNFLELHAKEYDYIFETGTSTITTNTFVENGLKYFYSSIFDGSKIGAVSACGSFYPAKNLFSYISSVAIQWGDANLNGSGLRSSGTQMYVNGWAALYKASVLASIPLKDIECPSCDVARSFWMAQHKIDACFNPFDFSGKLNVQNIYRFKNQRLKWAGGDSFILKNFWLKKYPDKNVDRFVKIHLFSVVICYVVGIICNLLSLVLFVSCPPLSSFMFNPSALVIGCGLGGIFGVFVIISWIIYKPNLRVIILTLICSLFDLAIIFKKGFKLLFVCLIGGKWSSKSITIKTTEKITFKQWMRICLFDFIALALVITLCLILTYFTTAPTVVVWAMMFTTLGMPSALWIILMLLSLIPTKKGWDNQTKHYDIFSQDYRFKYIKESAVWKKQHSN